MSRKTKIHATIAYNGASYSVKAIAGNRNISLAARTFDDARNELISTLRMFRQFGSLLIINGNMREAI